MTCSMVYVVHVKQKYKVAKKFYFPIFPAFTLHSQWLTVGSSCIHLLYPLRIVCAHHSESAHLALTVCSAFTYHSVPLHSFSTPKWKDPSLRALTKWVKNMYMMGPCSLYLPYGENLEVLTSNKDWSWPEGVSWSWP